MKNLDLYSRLAVRRAVSPQSDGDNTALASQIIDRQGFTGLLFAIAIGSVADADATFTTLVEHGDADNLSDAAAVPDAELNGSEAAASFQYDDDNETRKIGYVGNKRYVRLTITPANNASAALVSAIAVLGGADSSPVE
ncbi:MAG TPA: hypothetical protein VGB54_11215 [Allosphingosinicella sp.]|jgi:hypothetical protein